MITQTIGRKLRQYRQKQGYSQEALADRAGLATLPEREQAKLYTILAQIRTLF